MSIWSALHDRSLLMPWVLYCLLAATGNAHASEVFAVELNLQEHAPDGCTSCGCRLSGVLEQNQAQHWWMTFAQVEPIEDEDRWRRRGPEALSYCGNGKFKAIDKYFLDSKGWPYLIAQVEVAAVQKNLDDPAKIEIEWTLSSFSTFRKSGKAVYEKRKLQRQAVAEGVIESLIPVLNANPREEEVFGILGLVASLRVTPVILEGIQFGRIEVSSDFPGARVLLDGVLAGRIREGEPFVLNPVLAGVRKISVRDYSNRRAEQTIDLKGGQVVGIRLDLLDINWEENTDRLNSLGTNSLGFEEFWRHRDGAVMVHIPGGEFPMGSDNPTGQQDAQPRHLVHVSDFLIDKTEVTWRQYRKYAEATGAPLPPEPLWGYGDDFALSHTIWKEANAYCAWAGGRLPTEAEWEKAARGVDDRDYPWGQEWDSTHCNSISGGLHQPEPVGSFPACLSPYGVLDMVGSHWQWVSDFYGEKYYRNSPESNPSGPGEGVQRAKRGGYWMNHPQQLKVTRRGKSAPDWRNVSHGFRCAKTLERQTQ